LSRDKLKPATAYATTRFLRAYLTTFVVLSSYAWLGAKARIFGGRYRGDHVDAVHRRNARRIEATILALQGLFIKVGQLFSIMTNFLPEEFRSGLADLQDAVPARPYEQIERRVREELGGAPEEVFAEFERTPIASASLGQVHRATTREGQVVAVKVQHLGVEEMARADLKTIWRIVRIVRRFFKTRGIENYYHEIRAMIVDELDFLKEAGHIEAIAENFKDNDKVVFPRVHKSLSTSRILTLGWVDGIKIADTQRLREAGLEPAAVARDLLKVYCQMIFVDGLYHADPHPGNVLVRADGAIVLLDFGAVGRLEPSMRQGISSFLEAIIKGDEEQLLRSLRMMGFLRVGSEQSDAAARIIEHFHRKFQDEIRLESFSLSAVKLDTRKGFEQLADLHEMDVGLREVSDAFHMPREWVLLERTALLLTGLCTHLDRNMNPADTIRPYLEEFVLGKDRDWSEMLFDVTREKLFAFLQLPSMAEKVVNRSLAGKVSFRVEGIQRAADQLYAAAHQLMFTLLASVAACAAIYCHSRGEPEIAKYAAYVAGAFGLLTVLSMLRARRHARRR
jgi:predicted unusual protein kinase regulating ubiquinone biosynthesis (AarF/ABC1/UbiB family)